MNVTHSFQGFWLFPLAIISILLWRQRSIQKNTLSRIFEPGLIEKVFPFRFWKRWSLRKILFQCLGLLSLVIALCGPQIGQKLEEIKVKGSTVFILFDCSDSMLAEDLKPTRMERAKILLSGLLERLHGTRVGIIAFAGEPYVYCPITLDLTAAKQFLKTIDPGMIPQPGTKIGAALRLALSKMPDSKGAHAVILLTDGEDHRSDPLGAAREAQKMRVKIFAIGIGSLEGEPIPIKDPGGNISGYKKNKKGDVVLSKMDEATLSQMALITDGVYFRASSGGQEIDLLADKLEELEKEPLLTKQSVSEDRYQWFLILAFVSLLASEFLDLSIRRSAHLGAWLIVLSLLLFSGLVANPPLHAESFQGQVRSGNKLYRQENYSEALKKYERAETLNPKDPRASYNKGTALYKLKDWEHAEEAFKTGSGEKEQKDLVPQSLYNLGNTQFQKGQYADAVRSFQESLKLNPNDADARYNLKLAVQFQKNPPPQKKQSKDPKNGNDPKNSRSDSSGMDREKMENAKRTLKSAADEGNNRPIFKPDEHQKRPKEDEEDW